MSDDAKQTTDADAKQCRWGIVSTAKIGRKNWKSILDSPNSVLVGVASRSVEKAQAFIDDLHSVFKGPEPKPKAYGSYDALYADPDVDAVYISLPTGIRVAECIKAAEHGKAVLTEKPCGVDVAEVERMVAACEQHGVQLMDGSHKAAEHGKIVVPTEKPCGVDVAEVERMVAACEQRSVQLMDGVMFMHNNRLNDLQKSLYDTKSIGDVTRVNASFTFNPGESFFKENIRVSAELEPLGCLGDLGIYCIRFALAMFQYDTPEAVRVDRHEANDVGVPLDATITLYFSRGRVALLHCSFRHDMYQTGTIQGTEGRIVVKDYVLPIFGKTDNFFIEKFTSFGDERDMSLISNSIGSSPGAHQQHVNMFSTMSKLVGGKTVDKKWHRILLQTHAILIAAKRSSDDNGARIAIDSATVIAP